MKRTLYAVNLTFHKTPISGPTSDPLELRSCGDEMKMLQFCCLKYVCSDA